MLLYGGDGIDTAGDGEDGNPDDAIHVSVDGSASGTGTIEDPVDTISAGIDLAIEIVIQAIGAIGY